MENGNYEKTNHEMSQPGTMGIMIRQGKAPWAGKHGTMGTMVRQGKARHHVQHNKARLGTMGIIVMQDNERQSRPPWAPW
ncbi:hypothetical protein P7K49_007088 [Saguinus oedipus]|uniref:Uncharacterized protein n=1 Tax=Saguinus oedipus TaxID=9490 RepID=A0ABQ9W4A2_SAGOE|nr:hypothetical protein P7K49_007088 [Saguinus oedipus]